MQGNQNPLSKVEVGFILLLRIVEKETVSMSKFLEWQYLLFLGPLGIAILLVLLSAFGLLGDHDVDHDFEGAGNAEVAGGHEIGDHDADTDSGSVHTAGILSFLGFGKAPLTVTLISLFLFWGIGGYIVIEGGGLALWPLAILVASLSSLGATRLLSGLFARYMKPVESYHQNTGTFVSNEGAVIQTVTGISGVVRTKDRFGSQLDFQARVRSGEKPLVSGTKVVLIDYIAESRYYYVMPTEEVLGHSGL